MSNIPTDIKTADEARDYLARHGYGLGDIELEMASWSPPAPAAKAAPAPKAAPKKVSKD